MQDRKNLQPTVFAMHCSWSNLMMQGGTFGTGLASPAAGPTNTCTSRSWQPSLEMYTFGC